MKEWKEMAYSIYGGFQKRNQRRLRKLNDHILKEVAIEFSKSHYDLAVVSYVLSKIVSKPRFLNKEYEGNMTDIEKALKKLAGCVDSCPPEETDRCVNGLYETIKELEKGDARFLIDLVSKGKLKVMHTREMEENETLGAGEKSALALFRSTRADAIITDDARFISLLEKENVPFIIPADAIVWLVKSKTISKWQGIDALDKIRNTIRKPAYAEAKKAMEDKQK